MGKVGEAMVARPTGLTGRFRQRLPGRLLWLGAILAIIKFWGWWVSPEHRIEQFAASAQHGDPAGMLALMDPKEVEHLGFTPERLEAMLADAAGSPGGVTIKALTWESLNERQSRYNRWARLTVRARNGAPLIGASGEPLQVIVEAYNTDAGWKIGGSSFIVGLLAARTGYAFKHGYYAALCARHGVAPEVFAPENATWVDASAAP